MQRPAPTICILACVWCACVVGATENSQSCKAEGTCDEWDCTGDWDCGEVPSVVSSERCDVLTRRRCADLTSDDVTSLLAGIGDFTGAVYLEGCDELKEFSALTSALTKPRLAEVYGGEKTRLAENMAGIFGPDNNPIWFDNVTIGEYISDMADRLPYHAFNAYDQVNAAVTILKQEGFLINTTKDRDAARAAAGATGRGPGLTALQEFDQAILTLSPKGADMPFHQHYSSWLYLAHGRKLWLLSPPKQSPPPELLWNDPWDVIKGWPQELAAHDENEQPALQCMQKPGDILYIPKDWWHATANMDDCVGIGGHMHSFIDDRVLTEYLEANQPNIKKHKSRELGIRHAMAELSPWKGASMMELAKMYFQKRDFKAMITMSSRFNARVIEVYKKGQLTDDKLENYMVNYMTVPLLQEIDKMARGMEDLQRDLAAGDMDRENSERAQSAAKHIRIELHRLQRMMLDLWEGLWSLLPELDIKTVKGENYKGVPLREYFKGWGDVPPLDFKLAPEPTNTKRRKKSRGKASKNPGG